jgi:hypothetical protein
MYTGKTRSMHTQIDVAITELKMTPCTASKPRSPDNTR